MLELEEPATSLPTGASTGSAVVEKQPDGGLLARREEDPSSPASDVPWSDPLLGPELGVAWTQPHTEHHHDLADRAFGLVSSLPRSYVQGTVRLTPKGARAHPLGPANAFAVRLTTFDGSASMGGVSESWAEDVSGEVVALDRTELLVEARLAGTVVYETTARAASHSTTKTRIDLRLRCAAATP